MICCWIAADCGFLFTCPTAWAAVAKPTPKLFADHGTHWRCFLPIRGRLHRKDAGLAPRNPHSPPKSGSPRRAGASSPPLPPHRPLAASADRGNAAPAAQSRRDGRASGRARIPGLRGFVRLVLSGVFSFRRGLSQQGLLAPGPASGSGARGWWRARRGGLGPGSVPRSPRRRRARPGLLTPSSWRSSVGSEGSRGQGVGFNPCVARRVRSLPWLSCWVWQHCPFFFSCWFLVKSHPREMWPRTLLVAAAALVPSMYLPFQAAFSLARLVYSAPWKVLLKHFCVFRESPAPKRNKTRGLFKAAAPDRALPFLTWCTITARSFKRRIKTPCSILSV